MNIIYKVEWKVRAISLAVTSLFIANCALADEAEMKALTQPQSSVQVEAITVDATSAKFGEYNGLDKLGGYVNGAFSVKGGGAYRDNEQGNTSRWSVTGDNLGLTSRSAGASLSDQGNWSLGVNYDQLQHNITNTYQTPYQGQMGGSGFTLPSTFIAPVVSTTRNCSGGLQANAPTGVSCLQQSNGFQGMDISSTRFNTTLNGTAIVDKNLNFTFEYNNLKQEGAKLQAFAGAKAANSQTVESISILPTPTNYITDTINLAANWKGDDSHVTASYFGSYFQNNSNNGFKWQPFTQDGSVAGLQTMSLAPSNVFNQLNLAGGYNLSNKTKLAGNFSYGVNSQNASYAYDQSMMQQASPTSSMNGVINTTHADLRVTDQTLQDLTLGALAKFDQRENLTQSNMYQFLPVGSSTAGAYMPNTPMNIKQMQINLTGDYKIAKDQKLNVTYANNAIDRWCNSYGAPTGTAVGSTSPAGTAYLNSPNCVAATASQENTLDALYKIKVGDEFNFKIGGGYGYRHTDWNQYAVVAMPPGTSAQSSPPNSANFTGFVPFFEASRKQFVARAGSTWNASEELSFNLGGKYTNDTYPNSTYGVQNGYTWSLNLDGNYVYTQDGVLTAYATQQNNQRSMISNANYSAATTTAAAAGQWQNQLQSNATTFGLAAKQGGLVNGKLTLGADLTYSIAKSIYSTQSLVSGGCATTTGIDPGTCGSAPAIQNNLAVLKFNGTYQLDKNSKIGLSYWYQHLYSNDYYYNASQYGYVQASTSNGLLPTGQQSPGYSVNVISANYTYTFD